MCFHIIRKKENQQHLNWLLLSDTAHGVGGLTPKQLSQIRVFDIQTNVKPFQTWGGMELAGIVSTENVSDCNE